MNTKLLSVAVGILFAFGIVESVYLASVASGTHRALCSYYTVLVNDRNASAKFLIDHPHPGPVAGLTEKQVIGETRARINRQTKSIDALHGLGCPEPPALQEVK